MIKFISIEEDDYKGFIYNGEFDKETNNGYIHWIPGQQSTNIYYYHKICLISDSNKIECELEDNDVFKLVKPSELSQNINDIIVKSFNGRQKLYLDPFIVENNKYFYIIYFIAKTDSPGEYLTDIKIDSSLNDHIYIRIGGDFYESNESLYINLLNFGIDIPLEIQKTFYDTNIKECNNNNILLNRKFKELLSNYWDIIANKGSYKSLNNSLKWFEWGDKVKLKELWSHIYNNNYYYDMRDISPISNNYYNDVFKHTNKTTYISLICEKNELYNENDKLKIKEKNFSKTQEELSLKLCLLGNFYETYFLPIHIDLIHSSYEIAAVGGNFYLHSGNKIENIQNRNIYSFDCNIKNNSTFFLKNVSCQVGTDTLFKNSTIQSNYNDNIIVGVDEIYYGNLNENNDFNLFYAQYFNEIGYIVKFNCTFPKILNIKEISTLTIINNNTNIVTNLGKNFTNIDSIDFNILFKNVGKYLLKIKFIDDTNTIFYKELTINIYPIKECKLQLYKIVNYQTNLVLPNTFYFKKLGNNYKISSNQIQYINGQLGEYLEEFNPVIIENNTIKENPIYNNEYLFVTPTMTYSEDDDISDINWIFKNKCGESLYLKGSRISAIIAPIKNGQIADGYYDIFMNYKLNGVRYQTQLLNAFKKIS